MLDATTTAASGRNPSVVLHGTVAVGGTRPLPVLREAGLNAIELPVQDGIESLFELLPGPPDLLLVTLDSERDGLLRELRSNERGWRFPVLGVARLRQVDTDVGLLRAQGIVGVIDARTRPDAAVARIVRQLQLGPCALQGSERARSTFPVGVSVGGSTRTLAEPVGDGNSAYQRASDRAQGVHRAAFPDADDRLAGERNRGPCRASHPGSKHLGAMGDRSLLLRDRGVRPRDHQTRGHPPHGLLTPGTRDPLLGKPARGGEQSCL